MANSQKKHLKQLAASGLVAAGLVASVAGLSTTAIAKTKTPVAEVVTQNTQLVQVSSEAQVIVSNIQNARLALFDGQVDAAKDLVKKARAEFKNGLEQYAIKDAKAGYVIPLQSGVVFAEGFQPNEKHMPAITEAGEVLRNGDMVKAVNIMTKAGVDLNVATMVIPVKSTMSGLDKALKNLDNGDYYAANLTLKTIESALDLRSYNTGDLPQQGYAVTDVM